MNKLSCEEYIENTLYDIKNNIALISKFEVNSKLIHNYKTLETTITIKLLKRFTENTKDMGVSP